MDFYKEYSLGNCDILRLDIEFARHMYERYKLGKYTDRISFMGRYRENMDRVAEYHGLGSKCIDALGDKETGYRAFIYENGVLLSGLSRVFVGDKLVSFCSNVIDDSAFIEAIPSEQVILREVYNNLARHGYGCLLKAMLDLRTGKTIPSEVSDFVCEYFNYSIEEWSTGECNNVMIIEFISHMEKAKSNRHVRSVSYYHSGGIFCVGDSIYRIDHAMPDDAKAYYDDLYNIAFINKTAFKMLLLVNEGIALFNVGDTCTVAEDNTSTAKRSLLL